MSYSTHIIRGRERIIPIGSKSQYVYHYMNYQNNHSRLVKALLSQILKDLLQIAYGELIDVHRLQSDSTQDPIEIPDLSEIEFRCECEDGFMGDHTVNHPQHRNRLREHNLRNHICMQKLISLLKPLALKIIAHNYDKIEKSRSDVKDQIANSNRVEPDKTINLTDIDTDSWYNAIHNGEFDDFNEIDETSGIGAYDIIRSHIEYQVRSMMRDVMICRRSKNPIVLLFEKVNGYRLISLICETTNAAVIRAEKEGREYAIKMGVASLEGNKVTNAESTYLHQISNSIPNVSSRSSLPHLYESFDYPSVLSGLMHHCLVFDLCGLDLFEKILNREPYANRGLRVSSVRYITYQLVMAISHLHNQNIIHNDIKLENILFRSPRVDKKYILCENIGDNPDLDVVLIDYGLSIENGKTRDNIQGTIPYLSPEELEGNIGSFETDIWSLGIVLLELVTGIGIFTTDVLTNMLIVESITGHRFLEIHEEVGDIENYEILREEFFSDDRYDSRGVKYDMHYIPYSANDEQLADFLSGCLNPNIKERYDIQQLLFHPFIRKYTQDIGDRKIVLD